MGKKVFSWSPIRKLMKDNGAEVVARNAVEALIKHLESCAGQISSQALALAKQAGRKKITQKDMKLAMDMI